MRFSGAGAGTGSGSALMGRTAVLMVQIPRRAEHRVLKTSIYGLKYHCPSLCEQRLLFFKRGGGGHMDVISSK